MLPILAQAGIPPEEQPLPKSAIDLLAMVEARHGRSTASRLRKFVGQCVADGLKPLGNTKHSVPFRRFGLIKQPQWDTPRASVHVVFYFADAEKAELEFRVREEYSKVVGLKTAPIETGLKRLGFRAKGKKEHLIVDLKTHNDDAFFNELLLQVRAISDAFDKSMQTG